MDGRRRLLRGLMVLAIAAAVVAPASATTLIRQSLEDLVASNGTIVVGKVLDAHSYWNADGTFILTDVRFGVADVLKGRQVGEELTITVMGGTVGDLTTLIIAGAELFPDRSYVLFLNKENLPGVESALTVREHCQGAFNIVRAKDGGLRAVSQANGHPLVPDVFGYFDAPGGTEGFALDAMVNSIRDISERQRGARPEVN